MQIHTERHIVLPVLSVRPSTAATVSKRMVYSFFSLGGRVIILVFRATPLLHNSTGNPLSGALNTRVWKNLANIALNLKNGTR